jgi:hypothetical protein
MGVKRRLGELSCLYSVLSSPFGNRVQCPSTATVQRNRSSPAALVSRMTQRALKSRLTTSSALGLTVLPFEPGWKGFYVLPRAELLGELSDALGALLRDEDRDLAQLLR